MTTNASSVDDRVDLSLGFGHLTLDSDAQSTTGANTPITPITSTSAERSRELPGDATAEKYALSMRWQEAQERCRQSLRGRECELVLSFTGPDQLAADLQRREQEYSDNLRRQLIAQIYPYLRFVQMLSGVFLSVMRPTSIETALLWGVLHLAINGSVDSTTSFTKLVDMINKIKRELELFARFASSLNEQQEMRQALVDMFVALITFWAEAVKYLRRSTAGHVTAEIWPKLNEQFQLALDEMNRSVDVVYKLASVAKLETEAEVRRQNNADILTMITADNETARAKFPCKLGFHADPNFRGRRNELNAIRHHLQPSTNQDFRSVVIHSIGGMGKTALARAFASESEKAGIYDAIFFIHASNAAQLRESFTKISERLDLLGASRLADADKNVVLVKNWLGATNKKCLLIYDNVDDLLVLSDFLPPGSGSVLITTRIPHVAFHAPGIRETIDLSGLELDEGIDLFNTLRMQYCYGSTAASFKDEVEDTRLLIQELGGLALGIEQMAAYIGTRKWKVGEFLAKYKKMDKVAEGINNKHDGSSHSLATVWEMHFQLAFGKPGANLMGIASMLSPDRIPIDLLVVDDSSVLQEYSKFCDEEADVEDAIDGLMKFALIKRDGSSLSLHRLVQRAFIFSQYGLGASCRQEAFDAATKLVNHRFPKTRGSPLFEKWEICADYLAHAISLAEFYKTMKRTKNPLNGSDEFDELVKNASWYQYEIGELQGALDMLMIGFDGCQDANGLQYAHFCNMAGCIYFERNDLARCRKVHEKARAIREPLGDPDNELQNTYSNMANLLLSEGRLDDSLEMNEKAMKLRAPKPGVASIYLALNHMMTGRIHRLKEDFPKARECYQRSGDMFVQLKEGESFLRGCLYYDLGNLELTLGHLLTAKDNYNNAYKIVKKLGPTQTFMGSVLYKLGLVEAKLGDPKQASKYYSDSLKIAKYRKMDGEIARNLRQQAILLEAGGHLSEDQQREVEQLKIDAQLARVRATAGMEASFQPQGETDDEAYDNLCCGYYR